MRKKAKNEEENWRVFVSHLVTNLGQAESDSCTNGEPDVNANQECLSARAATPTFTFAGPDPRAVREATKIKAQVAVIDALAATGCNAIMEGEYDALSDADCLLRWEDDVRFLALSVLWRRPISEWDWEIVAFVSVDCMAGPQQRFYGMEDIF